MSNEKEKLKVATFRFGVIAEFVTGVKLDYGDKERLIKEKASRSYEVPFSEKTTISRATILSWIDRYKKSGSSIEGLMPKSRSDRGIYRTLDATIRIAVKELKKENPKLRLTTIIQMLRHKKILEIDEKVNMASLYRFLEKENLTELNTSAEDRRRWESELSNETWQCDVLHGPKVRIDGIMKKTYLCAIIDDHSRLITHAQFYLSEGLDSLKHCLKEAVQKRGLPQKFYVDNGACYRAGNLEQITASLGISLYHSRPYVPQGRGKIERWFKSVRECFLPLLSGVSDLGILNDKLEAWIYEYNNRIHGTTKQPPLTRYTANMSCVRPAPAKIIDYFRFIEIRRVKKDRTFRLRGKYYEAPVSLIDKRIELKFHENNLDGIEIFFDNRSFGFAVPLDEHLNSKIGRDWSKQHVKDLEILTTVSTLPSGELFKGARHDPVL